MFIIKKFLQFKGVRDPVQAKRSVESFIDESLTEGKVFYEKCDTGDMKSVRVFAKNIQEKFKEIHLLINNGKQISVIDE